MPAFPEKRYHIIEDIEALPEGEGAEPIDGQIYRMTAAKRLHKKKAGKSLRSSSTTSTKLG